MQKILIICTVPTERSGIPNVIFNLLNGINWDGMQLGYVSINHPPETYQIQLNKLNIKSYYLPRKIRTSLTYVRQLVKIAQNYDIVHVHGNSATMVLEMIAAKIAGVKIRIAHSHNTQCSMKLIDILARPLFYSLCNGRLACGFEAGKWLYGKRPFKTINNGINPEKYKFNIISRNKIRESLGLSNEVIVGHIGNFVDQKNHEFLIDVFCSCHIYNPTIKLLLLGDGELKKNIKERVEKLKLSKDVIWGGSVENVYDYMSAMDIIVMPSKFEGLPLTLVEQQANGLSILASDVITPYANITGDIHFMSLNDTPDEWAKKMFSIISNSSHNELSSEKNIDIIKKSGFDIGKIAMDLKDFYISLLDKFNSL